MRSFSGGHYLFLHFKWYEWRLQSKKEWRNVLKLDTNLVLKHFVSHWSSFYAHLPKWNRFWWSFIKTWHKLYKKDIRSNISLVLLRTQEPLPGDSKSSKSLKLFLIKTVNCPPSYYLILAIQVQESLKILKAIKFCPSV